MNYYFYDLENLHSRALHGVDKLIVDDVVYIFYSDNLYNLNVDVVEELLTSKATIEFVKTLTGKNAMDFYMTGVVALLVERHKEENNYFNIISKDNDFRHIQHLVSTYYSNYEVIIKQYCDIKTIVANRLTEEDIVRIEERFLLAH